MSSIGGMVLVAFLKPCLKLVENSCLLELLPTEGKPSRVTIAIFSEKLIRIVLVSPLVPKKHSVLTLLASEGEASHSMRVIPGRINLSIEEMQ